VKASVTACDTRLELRARQSLGSSNGAIYRMVASALRTRKIAGGHVVDVGCGGGALWGVLRDEFSTYTGVDAVRYESFPPAHELHLVDLDHAEWPIAPGAADLVVAVETIEHLENPRAFMRALVRIAKPGGWVVVTTPNQLSCLSLATLLAKRRFSAFQDAHYPAHRTALLETDLVRIAGESGLTHVALAYSESGRVPLTPWHYPRMVARLLPRALSDNLMLIGRTPRD
jgi:2-polyprenyl-3-methyl-5-hydroxy-6-metoxy-1,4-benzoquinol methylase